jgi:putative tricarboxylic transport membrane protein
MRSLGDIIGGLFFLALGIWAIIGAHKLHVGTVTEPQPGFFPFLGGVTLAALSGILLFQALLGRSKGTGAFGALWRPIAMIMGLVLYVAILDSIGYILATIVLSLILLRALDTKTWWVLAVAALCITFGSYILFDRALGVTLPRGLLGF